MIKLSVKPRSTEQFIERAVRQGRAVVRRQGDVLGESMVREVEAIVAAEFNEGDPGHRKPGPHLAESFTYEVDERADGVGVTLTIKNGVSAKKVAALNYGTTKKYTIEPSGVIVGFGGRSINRRTAQRIVSKSGIGGRPNAWLTWPDPGGGRDVFARVVNRGPFEGKHFMERAVEQALDKMRQRLRSRR